MKYRSSNCQEFTMGASFQNKTLQNKDSNNVPSLPHFIFVLYKKWETIVI